MQDILMKAACYIAIIVMGYVLRKKNFFGPEAFVVLSKIVMKITLPCAIIASSAGKPIDISMLSIVLLGLGGGILYMILAAIVHRKHSNSQRAFAVLNTPGYNIGTFAMPFTQSFLGGMGVITTSLFDMGNAFIALGGAYGIAAAVKNGSGFDLKRIGKGLITSVPFMAHLTMVLLNLFRLTPPAPVVNFAQIIANGNAFLAMLMIGVGFNLSGDKSQIRSIFRILSVRYGLAAVLALCYYFLLPFELEVRQALVILAFSPIGSAVPVFTAELKEDVGLSAAINSIAILISIVIIVALLIVML